MSTTTRTHTTTLTAAQVPLLNAAGGGGRSGPPPPGGGGLAGGGPPAGQLAGLPVGQGVPQAPFALTLSLAIQTYLDYTNPMYIKLFKSVTYPFPQSYNVNQEGLKLFLENFQQLSFVLNW